MRIRSWLALPVVLFCLGLACAQKVEEFLLQASQLIERNQLTEAADLFEKGLQRYPNDAALLIQAAGLLIHLGRAVEGEKLLDRALQLEPHDPRILTSQGAAKLRQGKLAEAAERFRRAIWHQSKDAQAHNRLAFTLFLQGDEGEAHKHARQAVELSPLNIRYRRFYSLLLNLEGKTEESYQQLRTAWRLDPENPDLLHQLSRRSRNRGQLGQALEYAEIAWEIDPQNPLYAHHLAKIYRQIGERNEAEKFETKAAALDQVFASYTEALQAQKNGQSGLAVKKLEEALEKYPDFEMALFQLARLYSSQGQHDAALRSYERLLSLNPEHQAAREEGAWLHVAQGSLEKALLLLDEPGTSSTNRLLLSGYQAMQKKDWPKAVELLGQVVSENPLTPDLLELLAFSLRELGEPEKALALLNKASALTSSAAVQADIAQVHLSEAIRLQDAQRWDEAIAAYGMLLQGDPKNPTYLFNRAYCRQQVGQLASAVKDYRAASEREEQPWAQLNLASCLYRLQRYPESAAAWEKVVKSDPTADSYYRLGLSYSHLERHPEAEAAFSKALKMGLENPALLYNLGLARLKTLRVEDGWKLIRESAHKGYPPAAQLVARLRRR